MMYTVGDHLKTIGGLCCIEAGAMYIIDRCFTQSLMAKGEAMSLPTRVMTASTALCVALAGVFVGTAGSAVMDLGATTDSRWFGQTEAGHWFMWVYVAHNLVGIAVELVDDIIPENKPAGEGEKSVSKQAYNKLPMIAHHALSIAAYWGGLSTGRMHYYACLDGLCEATNLFLCTFLLGREKTASVGANFTKYVLGLGSERLGNAVSTANSLLLWASFIPFRLVLFPTWLYWFAQDVMKMYGAGADPAFFSDPAHSVGHVSTFELTFYPVVTVFLFGLSSMWFSKMTAGVIKLLNGKDPMAKTKSA